MSNSFFIVLPSNTRSYKDNYANKFRVHLPKNLSFHGNWFVGLHSIVYPHTWPSIGTIEEQYIELVLTDGTNIRTPIPKGSYTSPEELEKGLYSSVSTRLSELLNEEKRARRKRQAITRRKWQ